MKKLFKDSIVKVDNKQIAIERVLPALINLGAEEIVKYFNEIGLTFPRQLRIDALREALNPYVENQELMQEILTDEENYRIRWYPGFSEHQLVNLINIIGKKELYVSYREQLWLIFLGYMFTQGVNEEKVNILFNRAAKSNIKNIPANSVEYNNVLNPLFYDEPNTIDGLKPGIFRPILYKCSTLIEIREIGLKYDVTVPRRLKKAELVEIIKDELHDRKELDEKTETLIDEMNVISLQRFAINNNIKASIELKKEEIIEYILKNATQTTQEYFKPTAFSAYEVVEGLEHLEEPEEPIEEEPIIDFFEEVTEEPVVNYFEETKEEPEVIEEDEEIILQDTVEEIEEPVIEEETEKEVPTETDSKIFANEVNVIYPYKVAVKKKALRKAKRNVAKIEDIRKSEREENLKDAVPVRIVEK